MSSFKVMKAANLSLTTGVRYPALVSPKIDGRRAFIENGKVHSSSGKPIRSSLIQSMFGHKELNGLDGELTVGSPVDPEAFRKTGAISSEDGDVEDSVFNVFDCIRTGVGFSERLAEAKKKVSVFFRSHLRMVDHYLVNSKQEIEKYEAKFLEEGYEGLMYRTIDGPYKNGRSTHKEMYLMKLKRFTDGEAQVTDFVEMMHNNNEKTLTAAGGKLKRGSSKAGKECSGVLGALVCRDLTTGDIVELGTGFTNEERETIWKNRGDYVGSIVKYKHFQVGGYSKPRHPVFLGFRDVDDM